jgi:hypothetical protein
MGFVCTIDLNPIVARDSMMFLLLFDDKVAVKPGKGEKNMGPRRLRSNRPRPLDLRPRFSPFCKMAGQRAGAFPSRGLLPLFFLHSAKSKQQTLWQHRSDK